jgi:endonuclease/exonuclease/phosphatase family metal-dependent hydrolase
VGAAAFILLAGQGCATALNYTDPAGPIFRGEQPSQARGGDQLKLVTFNIKFGREIDRAAGLLSQEALLVQPDILFVQEVDAGGSERLAASLGMNYVYVPSAARRSSGRDFGVAVLTPWPVGEARKIPLPGVHWLRKTRRSAVVATVDVPGGPVRAYSVHFETPFGAPDETRRAQARAILQDAAAWSGPVVVAGDFNGTSGADEMAKAGLIWLTRDVHNTSWIFDLDHIVARGLCAAATPPAVRGPKARGISDHRPVRALLRRCVT